MSALKLEVKSLKKVFGETEVLHGISFTVESGKALGLLGRNGAGKADLKLRNAYEINCSCGQTFTMEILVDRCPHCNMTYGVTPCSQGDVNNIKAAGINY